MAINVKRGSGRAFAPTPKQAHGQRAAALAKRAWASVAPEYGGRVNVFEKPEPTVRYRKHRRAVGMSAPV